MQKSPISVLQEYAMAKGIALPNYDIVSEDGVFKCIVNIGNIARNAKATSKKAAKHTAAEKAVSFLQSEGMMFNSIINSTIRPPDESDTRSDIIENKVGELNEFCSRKGLSYPIYEFEEHLGLFTARCKLLTEEADGKGKTKKEAKQVAAKRMLEIVTSGSSTIEALTRTARLSSPTASVSEETPGQDQMIIELFKKLSFKTETSLNGDTKFATPKNLTADEIDLLIEEARDGPSLENLLANLGVEYTISKFQRDPLILCVETKSNKHPSFTFLQHGTTESEIKVKLLKLVVDAIAVHL
ncbi:hypothetical protein PPYR_07787 [Photinus pyralis]|uniref:DRBM domain-containing protein n=1 Tax=Photinus pyralis TaxID=7054 RepID=A0A5N4ARF3_PHOPY|nr:hypothetical protein PPYR_07787 [Photinus pyralis]